MDVKVLYELEDILRFFIEADILDIYVDSVVDMWVLNKLGLKDTFNALYTFSQKYSRKLNILYDIKCPKCNERVSEYSSPLHVGIGETCNCNNCDYSFIKDVTNTYIFFRVSDDWSTAIKEINNAKKINIRKCRI